ncbi:MAG TPA: type II toxin-antitoxin system RelE/ParE family toxin [Ignavibacteria bacterium]|nr:type II toxin-antitoxin system RelE/ParE family toxin [Ignavibacteria bacterium]
MVEYQINLKRSSEKELERLPDKIHDRIVHRLLLLKKNPRPQSAKKLRGSESYRIRVSDYRILYIIDDDNKKVEIYSIAHRREAYR